MMRYNVVIDANVYLWDSVNKWAQNYRLIRGNGQVRAQHDRNLWFNK